MIRFRPLAGFTLLCLALFAILVGLGAWQLQRLQWKRAQIAQMNRNITAPPIDLDGALALGNERAQYRRVVIDGRFENSNEAYVFTTAANGAPVYHILTPLLLDDGRTIMVDRGYVPPPLREPASRPGSEPRGQQHVAGVWRTPDRSGLFTPPPDILHRIWFARDLSSIEHVDHMRLAAPAILEAAASSNRRTWPRGSQTRVDLPNDHLQYALTWFLLAGALVVVYFAYHRARGRLGRATVERSIDR